METGLTGLRQSNKFFSHYSRAGQQCAHLFVKKEENIQKQGNITNRKVICFNVLRKTYVYMKLPEIVCSWTDQMPSGI